MKLSKLTCNGLVNPLGIDGKPVFFNWIIGTDKDESDIVQTSYRITVFNRDKKNMVWDSGTIISDQSAYIQYEGQQLESECIYDWTVTVTDNHNATDSAGGIFETAFLNKSDWKAKWIEPEQKPAFVEPPQTEQPKPNQDSAISVVNSDDIKMEPPQYITKIFEIKDSVERARLYATAHGIYSASLNGNKIGDIEYAPGNSDYTKYLEYQVYDITHSLQKGINIITFAVADGWYRGKVGVTGQSCQFGTMLGCLFQLNILYADKTKQAVYSDEECTSSKGPVCYADIFVGEKYDANTIFVKAYDKDSSETKRTCVHIAEYGYDNLFAQWGPKVTITEIRKPAAVWKSPRGDIILDTGQVLCGRVRMRVKGKKGTKIILEHSETVDKNHNFVCNIIGKFVCQTDTYIMNGDENGEVFDPEFTFHGFRYVRITGYPGMPSVSDFDILIINTSMETTGSFRCSDNRLNQLQHNIYWSQRSNMLSIPTDCPQRERAGWTGDAQIFMPTACFNMNVMEFFRRWLKIMEKDQMPDGQIPNVVPYIPAYYPNDVMPCDTHCSAGWGDAAVIIPWALYQAYGDISILKDTYSMMKRWVSYIQHTAETEIPGNLKGKLSEEQLERQKYLWDTHFHFGDWLTPSVSFNFNTGDVDMVQSAFRTMDIVPTCFYAYSTELMSRIAGVLNFSDDEKKYTVLHSKIREAFLQEYVNADGTIHTNLQGIYVLALTMDLIPDSIRFKTVNQLVKLIINNGKKLDTGFLSTPFLLDVLSKNGRTDIAYDLLFQDECPSWLYEIKMGATSMWEAWQAILPDGTPTSVSYNHYAFGCVGDWIYRTIGGIHSEEPGYHKSIISPVIDNRITSASASVDTVYGKLSCEWELSGKTINFEITIPCNTSSTIYLPYADGQTKKVTVKSGTYNYSYTYGL